MKLPLLIVEPKQKLFPSAPDYMIPETAYDTIRTPIIFDFNGRVIIPWSVRRAGALGDNTVKLLSDMPHPLLNWPRVLLAAKTYTDGIKTYLPSRWRGIFQSPPAIALVMWTCGCGLLIVLLTYPPKTGVTYFQELPKQTTVEPGELAEIGGDAQVEWRDRSPIRSPFGHWWGYHQGKGCGRMTAKAESPPTNGNEMKVFRRTVCSWSNGGSALGFGFITDNRDINGILMIRNTGPMPSDV